MIQTDLPISDHLIIQTMPLLVKSIICLMIDFATDLITSFMPYLSNISFHIYKYKNVL